VAYISGVTGTGTTARDTAGKLGGGCPPRVAFTSSGEVVGSEPERSASGGGVVGDEGQSMKEKAPERGLLFDYYQIL
jgi:hypothetical protein